MMMNNPIDKLRLEITNHASNAEFTEKGWMPLFEASPKSKIAVIGQAPGVRAQSSGLAWDDASGQKLKGWLGVDDSQFRDTSIFALMPMDFYYPGKGSHGDLPPRKDFAQIWHGRLLKMMPNIQLTILIGQYAQKYYLGKNRKTNLTETVRSFEEYLPRYLPLVHPSPLNFRWHTKNTWFEHKVIPELQEHVASIIK